MQARLQRLVLDAQSGAGLFRRQPLQVSQDHRLPIDCRQIVNRLHEPLAQLPAQQLFVAHVGPVGRIVRVHTIVGHRANLELGHLERTPRPPAAPPRHGGVERDAVDPRRPGRVAAAHFDLAEHLHQHVLDDFLGLLVIAHVTEGELKDPLALQRRPLRNGTPVAPAEPLHEGGLVLVHASEEPGSGGLYFMPLTLLIGLDLRICQTRSTGAPRSDLPPRPSQRRDPAWPTTTSRRGRLCRTARSG